MFGRISGSCLHPLMLSKVFWTSTYIEQTSFDGRSLIFTLIPNHHMAKPCKLQLTVDFCEVRRKVLRTSPNISEHLLLCGQLVVTECSVVMCHWTCDLRSRPYRRTEFKFFLCFEALFIFSGFRRVFFTNESGSKNADTIDMRLAHFFKSCPPCPRQRMRLRSTPEAAALPIRTLRTLRTQLINWREHTNVRSPKGILLVLMFSLCLISV
jgi:hypothetical protein